MRSPITEFSHVYVFDAKSFRPVRGPLYSDLIVHIRPRRMMFLNLALIRDARHERPGLGKGRKGELAGNALFRLGQLPCRKELVHTIWQFRGLVGSISDHGGV